jgi:hypothetical protein
MANGINIVFEEVARATTEEEKVQTLQKYAANRVLLAMMVAVYHPGVQFERLLAVYATPDVPPGMGYTTMYQEVDKLYIFQTPNSPIRDVWRPHNPKLTTVGKKRKEEILVRILEGMEPKEAELLVQVINKKFADTDLNESVVRKAFPNLLGPDTATATQPGRPAPAIAPLPQRGRKQTRQHPGATF